jgi:uncharacterized protein (DUF427 family)
MLTAGRRKSYTSQPEFTEGASMPKAVWNGAVIAEARDDEVEIVENNVYFPLSAVRREYLQSSEHHSVCPWKGTASY